MRVHLSVIEKLKPVKVHDNKYYTRYIYEIEMGFSEASRQLLTDPEVQGWKQNFQPRYVGLIRTSMPKDQVSLTEGSLEENGPQTGRCFIYVQETH